MEQSQITKEYFQAVKAIKQAILESRYRAARLVNKEVKKDRRILHCKSG